MSSIPRTGPQPEGCDHPSPEEAYVAALAALPGMGPAGLSAILAQHLSPLDAWAEVRAGRITRPAARRAALSEPDGAGPAPLFEPGPPTSASDERGRASWSMVSSRLDPPTWWRPHAQAGTRVTWAGRADFPASLTSDPQPPGALFFRGRIEALKQLCVAIVGTRNATADGRAVAFQLGRDLAAAGICVVSGLALGIDGAAHAGALSAARTGVAGTTLGVAASGPDVAYPRRHARLWREVTAAGAIVSENLPGRPAQAWRFPARNRIIAGLSALVVVVESHERGGSLITAEAAIERGIEVRAVPGPVRSPASQGSNQLLYDGPGPVRDARDVLDALGIFRSDPEPSGPAGPCRDGRAPAANRSALPDAGRTAVGVDRAWGLDASTREVLAAVDWRPASTGRIMARSGLDSATVARGLDILSAEGLVTDEGGRWSRSA